MTIKTNLSGRIRNTKLAYNRGLMPLFEAVQNSIHAIEDADLPVDTGRITVEIVRDPQKPLEVDDSPNRPGPASVPDICGFRIRDNGIGFTEHHMTSFETLDTDHRADIGGRGVGRLLWLKAFDRATLDSTYFHRTNRKARRRFTFSLPNGVNTVTSFPPEADSDTGTEVFLEGFRARYREASRKTAEAVASSLFEHCLWYFVRQGGAPTILILDGDQTLNLDAVYEEHMHSSAFFEAISINGYEFNLNHIKLRSTVSKNHYIGWCASNRLVDEENLAGKIPGLYGRLGDQDNQFLYACYVTSDFLDESVLPERTGFVMQDTASASLFGEHDVAKEELTKRVVERAAIYLKPELQNSRNAGLKRVHDFVAHQKPQYRPIIPRIPDESLYVDPNISDKDLDVLLHKHKSESEAHLLSQGHKIMAPHDDEGIEEYQSRVADYLQLADDLKRSDLAEYISHRKVILDLLQVAIQRTEDGSYAREDLIHGLIMPMRKDSNSIEFQRNNLWLISERLTFHDFLASDTELRSMPITDSSERKRPDLMALNVFDESILLAEGEQLPLASIVVVEIKRPMRNDASSGEDRDPIEQTLGYLRRIRDGKMQTANGRPIKQSTHVPGYCYVLCDLTPKMTERCELRGLQVTDDHMGYFGYNTPLRAYIEVISFDQLLGRAKQRNRAFFDRLGLPAN